MVEAAPESPSQEGTYRLKHAKSEGSMSNSSQATTAYTADTLDYFEDEGPEIDSPPTSPRASEAPEAAEAQARDPPTRKGCARRWRLVWCHERVHRQECEAQKNAMGEAARRARASLTCIKKAGKFAAWLSHAQRPTYVLLTDWREVKPCLQAAAALPDAQRPAFTVVVAEEERLYNRARSWIATLPPGTEPVHVCRDTSFLGSFLDSVETVFAPGGAGELCSGASSKQNRECAAQALRSAMQEVAREQEAEACDAEAAWRRPSEEMAEKRGDLEEELSTASMASTSEGRCGQVLPEPAGAGASATLQQEHLEAPTPLPKLADAVPAPGWLQQEQQERPETPVPPPTLAGAIPAPGRWQQEQQRAVAWRPAVDATQHEAPWRMPGYAPAWRPDAAATRVAAWRPVADATRQEALWRRQQHGAVVDFAGPISQVLSLCHPQLLEKILRQAMPDRYDD